MVKTTVLSQIMQLISSGHFSRTVKLLDGDRYTKHFTCKAQMLVMLIAQAKGLKSLRDIVTCLWSHPGKWYHWGIKNVARSTLADANNKRSAAIFERTFYHLKSRCEQLAPPHKFKFKNRLYSLDSTTITLCLSMFDWAKYRTQKGGLKIHTLLDHRGTIPSFIYISPAKRHDVKVMQDPATAFPDLEPDSIIAMDRAYIDYKWLYGLHSMKCFWVTRAKRNMAYSVVGQLPVKASTNVLSDEIVVLSNYKQAKAYPDDIRRITYCDPETGTLYTYLTNNYKLAASTIAAIYKDRWSVETFFKWIKQNLKIKTFLGTSENAVMTQVWIAMIYYLLLKFIKYQSKCRHSMLDITRIIREKLMENVSIFEFLTLKPDQYLERTRSSPQLTIF